MRKQAAAVLLAAGLLGGASATSHGGEAAVDDRGNFLATDVDLAPPVAGTRSKPQPATLTFHHMFGNYLDGSQRGGTSGISVRLPRGMRTNPQLVRQCPLPTSDAEIRDDRCPAASRVGTGTALADARSLGVPNPVPARVTAYNGAESNGAPTFILQGVATVSGNKVVTEFDFVERRGSGRFGIELATFDPYPSPPADPNAPGIALNKLDLTAGKTINTRVRGRRVRRGYLETPTSCTSRGWAFEEEFRFSDGSMLRAGDVMACTR